MKVQYQPVAEAEKKTKREAICSDYPSVPPASEGREVKKVVRFSISKLAEIL